MAELRSSRRAFTLVELLVVIGIIALLISILLPALSKVRRQAQEVVDVSNIRQVAVALITYSADNKGMMLPAEDFTPANVPGSVQTANRLLDSSWAALTAQYKIPASAYGCNTMTNLPQSVLNLFGLYQSNWRGNNSAVIGWNYFGGRVPNPPGANASTAYRTYLDPGTKTYQPFNVLHHFYDKQASSQVLLTCINYDDYDATQSYESICPHYKGTALYIPPGAKWKHMDGLHCAFVDGHAVYVPYAKLTIFHNSTAGTPSSYAFIPPPQFSN